MRSVEWDLQAGTFDREPDHGLLDPSVRGAWIDLIVPLMPPAPASILDVGCGTGSLSVLLAQAGYAVRGIDFSEGMVATARAKAAAAGVAARFEVDDRRHRRSSRASCDVVLGRHILWALPDPGAALTCWTADVHHRLHPDRLAHRAGPRPRPAGRPPRRPLGRRAASPRPARHPAADPRALVADPAARSAFFNEAGLDYGPGAASALDLLGASPGGPGTVDGLLLIGIVLAALGRPAALRAPAAASGRPGPSPSSACSSPSLSNGSDLGRPRHPRLRPRPARRRRPRRRGARARVAEQASAGASRSPRSSRSPPPRARCSSPPAG